MLSESVRGNGDQEGKEAKGFVISIAKRKIPSYENSKYAAPYAMLVISEMTLHNFRPHLMGARGGLL